MDQIPNSGADKAERQHRNKTSDYSGVLERRRLGSLLWQMSAAGRDMSKRAHGPNRAPRLKDALVVVRGGFPTPVYQSGTALVYEFEAKLIRRLKNMMFHDVTN